MVHNGVRDGGEQPRAIGRAHLCALELLMRVMAEPHHSNSNDSSTDPALLTRARDGDESAWRLLVASYADRVCAQLRTSGVAVSDRDDLQQQVFAAVTRGIKTFDRRNSRAFRAWLSTITRHLIADYFRARNATNEPLGGTSALRQLEQLVDPFFDVSSAGTVADPHWVARVEAVRASVQSRTWLAFWRTVIDDVPTKEVARELDMEVAAVRKARSRVLHKLRLALAPDGSSSDHQQVEP